MPDFPDFPELLDTAAIILIAVANAVLYCVIAFLSGRAAMTRRDP